MLGNICKTNSIFCCTQRYKNLFLRFLHENNTVQESIQKDSHVSHEISVITSGISKHVKDNTTLINTEVTDSKRIYPPGIFAKYVKKSETLQELFRLGVNLHRVEDNSEAAHFILCSSFKDIRDHIIFLKDLSVNDVGKVITANPLILKEHLEDLQVRVNYLKYKKFSNEMVARIVQNNAFWLSHSTQQIDEQLGFFQKHFGLSGHEVRVLATKNPRLITYNLDKIKLNTFVLKEEMGFTPEELKQILLSKPKLLMMGQNRILKAFEYLHNTMKIPLERIVQEPETLSCREKRLKERHLFLEKLNRAQYDPKKANYISLKSLISGTDVEFSTEIAKTSIEIFNTFLKTY